MLIRQCLLFLAVLFSATAWPTTNEHVHSTLADLKNYQVNSATMVSAGLPTEQHLQVLKGEGVTRVIDLISGNRVKHAKLVTDLDLSYYNIPVDWNNPTVDNFEAYVAAMRQQGQGT